MRKLKTSLFTALLLTVSTLFIFGCTNASNTTKPHSNNEENKDSTQFLYNAFKDRSWRIRENSKSGKIKYQNVTVKDIYDKAVTFTIQEQDIQIEIDNDYKITYSAVGSFELLKDLFAVEAKFNINNRDSTTIELENNGSKNIFECDNNDIKTALEQITKNFWKDEKSASVAKFVYEEKMNTLSITGMENSKNEELKKLNNEKLYVMSAADNNNNDKSFHLTYEDKIYDLVNKTDALYLVDITKTENSKSIANFKKNSLKLQ